MQPPLFTRFNAALDDALYTLSAYVVPVAVFLASLAATTLLNEQYSIEGARRLAFTSLVDGTHGLRPEQAVERIPPSPTVESLDTHLAETPFWFRFDVPASDSAQVVELPSRHALEATCWTAQDLRPLGHTNRVSAVGNLRASKTGFVIDLPPGMATSVVCSASHTGPAHISVTLWPADKYELSELKFHRNSGLLDGGLIVLSLSRR